MRVFFVACLGIVASFALTAVGESLRLDSTNGLRHFSPVFFGVPIIVGAGVALFAGRQAVLTSAASLAPWGVFLIVGANSRNSPVSSWLITIVLISLYCALGIGSAALVGRAITRLKAKRRPTQPETA